jgi:hypothetical protein
LIVSVHLADVGLRAALGIFRRPPRAGEVAGLTYAETVIPAPLGKRLLPAPNLGRVGLIAAWEDDAALDGFEGQPLARRLAGGWQVRLEPRRLSGHWAGMPGLVDATNLWESTLPRQGLPVEDDEPVAVLTLGRPRLGRALPFLRSAAAAEAEVVEQPALLASTGLAHPPRLVSTFSLWRSAAAMKEYSYGQAGAHQAAVRADRERPFHHESAFVRFRPYASRGDWDGRDPLAGLASGATS